MPAPDGHCPHSNLANNFHAKPHHVNRKAELPSRLPSPIATVEQTFRPVYGLRPGAKNRTGGAPILVRRSMRSFARTDDSAAREFVRKHNVNQNIYYSINPPNGALSKKAKKTDIDRVEFLHVDVDPDDHESPQDFKARILPIVEAFDPRPTAIVDSGNGFQMLWRLENPIPLNGSDSIADIEARNDALAKRFGASTSTRNIDRVFRLPGTINHPNAKKRSVGRPTSHSTLIAFNHSRHPLSAFPPTQKEETKSAGRSSSTDLQRILRSLLHLKDSGPYASRSELLLAFIGDCLRRGAADESIIAACLDEAFAGCSIYEHVKDNNGRPYIELQVKKARRSWEDGFECDQHGHRKARSQKNIRRALELLRIKVRHDIFQDRMTIAGLEGHDLLDDRAMQRLWLLIEERFNFLPAKDFFWTVLSDLARRDPFHPVRDYLDGLKWDGVKRIDTWLTTYGKAKDTPYVRAVGALMLIAAVRRVRRPGCKFDEMPVFESPQGTDKSSMLATLAVNPDWFSDDLPLGADSKKMIEHLRGRWIVEAAELNGMRRADVEHLKSFLSRQVDRARMSYDRMITEEPRQCIPVGTTNHEQYLKDLTGNRRYWPVKVEAFDLPALQRDRDQLWAEAAMRESQRESIRLDPALWEEAKIEQSERTMAEPWIDDIDNVLGDMEGKILAADAWNVIGLPAANRSQDHNARFGRAMKVLGWTRTKLRFDGKPQHCYVRGNVETDKLRQILVERTSPTAVTARYKPDPRSEEHLFDFGDKPQ
jgi:predicted P-loop ATPase